MPIFGILIFLIASIWLGITTIVNLFRFSQTRDRKYLKKLGIVWFLPIVICLIVLYHHYPITKDRVIGTYKIDTNFYPGSNAEWQRNHFSFEITENDDFIFYEKLKDGSQKAITGKIEWYRNSPPMLYRISLSEPHPLIDEYPALYRGNRKFYYVFESKFGNMFYRKEK